MKKFKFILSFYITLMICPILQGHTLHDTKEQSLMSYIYSCFSTPTEIIPAAEIAQKKVIIFDLDGVLCKTNDLQAFYEIGMHTVGKYLLHHGKPTQEKLFQVLQDAPAMTTYKAYNNGLCLPQIMVDWQCNAQDLRDIQYCMVQHICSLKNLSIEEKNLQINTVLMITTPEKLIATRQLIPTGVQLARNLKKLGYKLYILSNWDAVSFPLFQEKFPELFTYQGNDLFDGIMISGKAGIVKPDSKIYKALLKKFEIKPEEAIFIDDTLENIQVAETLGISSIYCQNKNIANVTCQLIPMLKA